MHSRADSGFVDVRQQQQRDEKIGKNLLLDLPPDLRNVVYELVFKQSEGVRLDFDSDGSLMPQHFFALAATCRQIRDECCDLPFWLNTFHLHVPVLQDLRVLRNKGCPPPPQQPLPRCGATQKRQELKPKNLETSAMTLALRHTAREFVAEAMRVPHVDELLARLERFISRPELISKMKRIHVDLGSQVDNVFIARFVTAWTQTVPHLRYLAERAQLQISFKLRVSRRLMLDHGFVLSSPADTMAELDGQMYSGNDLTLPELSAINTVRATIRETLEEKAGGPDSSSRRGDRTPLGCWQLI